MKKIRIMCMALLAFMLMSISAFAAANAPTSVSFVAGDGKVTINFVVPSNAVNITKYLVWIIDAETNSQIGSARHISVSGQVANQQSSVTVDGLENYKKYKFKIAAWDNGVQGISTAPSPSNGVIVGDPKPQKVNPDTTEFIPGDGKISIKFIIPKSTSAITKYVVWKMDGETGAQIGGGLHISTPNQVAGEYQTLEIDGLENGKSYKFKISAWSGNIQGDSPAPFPATPVICGILPKPENVSVEPGVGEAVVSFDEVDGALYYVVNVNGEEEYKAKSSPVKIIGLDSTQKHSISISAVNKIGKGIEKNVSGVVVTAADKTSASSVVINDAEGYQTASINNGANTLRTVITNTDNAEKMFYLIVAVYDASLEKIFMSPKAVTVSDEIVLTGDFGDLSGKTVKCFVWDEGLKPYNK